MGFSEVLLYHPGKLDWMAAGLPTEGEGDEQLTGELLHTDAPTCAPDERVGDIATRLDGWSWCAVVDDDGVVLGGIGRSTLVEQPDAHAFEAAEPGPQTYRASLPTSELVETMRQTGQDQVFVSDADGRFLGSVTREDLVADQ
jgi:CBS domain-containing protein